MLLQWLTTYLGRRKNGSASTYGVDQVRAARKKGHLDDIVF